MSKFEPDNLDPPDYPSDTPADDVAELDDQLLPSHTHKKQSVWLLAISACGVVFGDIGTSPLYVMKAAFSKDYGLELTPLNVYGLLSLVFWSLAIVITLKYIIFVMSVNDKGEGGVFALLSILRTKSKHTSKFTLSLLTIAAILGAALLYGDGVITPAISVISAIEGLEITTHGLHDYIVIMSVCILFCLFVSQRFGIDRISFLFGPLMIIWFLTIGALGLLQIIQAPWILTAINPIHSVNFFINDPATAFIILGVVVLCITGGEALYADLGQFNRRSITIAWLFLVWPSLILNYFGQGALLLMDETSTRNPFFALLPPWALYPMVAIATLAAIIASQAIISGAFSITKQAIHLDLLPSLKTFQTSNTIQGRIYMPQVNYLMMLTSIIIVAAFQSSTSLTGAYGIAVTALMVLTTILFAATIFITWRTPIILLLPIILLFLLVDISFFSANLLKFITGGWLPILIAILLTLLMSTWWRGREVVKKIRLSKGEKLAHFMKRIAKEQPHRIKGTGIFFTINPQRVPTSLNKLYSQLPVLYEKIVIISMIPQRQAHVPRANQIDIKIIGPNTWLVTGYYGYMQQPDTWRILTFACRQEVPVDLKQVTVFLYSDYLLPTGNSKLMRWQKRLFIWLFRNAHSLREYINIPTERIIEIGGQTKI
ncbi:KUP/HAK/KT family potassium transporter [Planctomycetota bacterium]|nr:KUP/HAK/KT family potassium transporter [Planctomycetota bacterium]